MGLESVLVRFLLRDGIPGQLSCPTSVTLLPQTSWDQNRALSLERRHRKHGRCDRIANTGWYRRELALLLYHSRSGT